MKQNLSPDQTRVSFPLSWNPLVLSAADALILSSVWINVLLQGNTEGFLALSSHLISTPA